MKSSGQAIAKWCKHCICWRLTQSWMPRATLKLTPQLKPSKSYTSRSNHYMQLHAESSQSSFVYHSSRNLSSLLGKLNCGKCWLSSWFNKFNSGNKLCKSATCCNSSLVFFPFLKKGRSGSSTNKHCDECQKDKKSWKYFHLPRDADAGHVARGSAAGNRILENMNTMLMMMKKDGGDADDDEDGSSECDEDDDNALDDKV